MFFFYFVLVPSLPVLDPPVTMEKAVQLNDDNNDTCLVLAQSDMYTWSAGAHRWFPERRGKCFHRGLSISRCVPEAIQASFTVTITGRHLVCSNSNINVLIGKTNWSQCETTGVYRKCTLSWNTESGSNGTYTNQQRQKHTGGDHSQCCDINSAWRKCSEKDWLIKWYLIRS